MNFKYMPMRREAGFTVVEMMVGVLIDLIAIVVMFQVFAVSEAQKRTTVGTGEAQQNGVVSLYLMERDARIAGYGLGFLPLLGCQTTGFYAPTASKFNFRLAPVVITNGLGGLAPDSITLLYGSTNTFQMPGSIAWATAPEKTGKVLLPTVGLVKVKESQYQFQNGDLIVLGEALNAQPPANPMIPQPCTLYQVTRQISGDTTQMIYSDLSYMDEDGANRPADFNPPLGIMTAPDLFGYTPWDETRRIGGRVTNLGRTPVANTYSVVNNQLVAQNIFRPTDPPVVISDGIVQIQAQYGYSSNCPSTWPGGPPIMPAPVNASAGYIPPCSMDPNASSVTSLAAQWPPVPNRDVWADSLDPAILTPNNWRQIIAMRFVIVARSTEKEKVNPATGVCDITPNLPQWTGADNRTIDVATNDPDWKCYRYRTYEGIVPIRNMIWSPDPLGSSVPPI